MKIFRKIYIEITNICNYQCSFCPEVEREKKILSPEHFTIIIDKVAYATEEICLHLMGEPLSHPDFAKIISICESRHVKINLTTNGSLLGQYPADFFFRKVFKQINFSIHSFKDNFPQKPIEPYLMDILQFSKLALEFAPELYINYRLWNLPDTTRHHEDNQSITNAISQYFELNQEEKVNVTIKKSHRIIGRIYYHFDTKFDWPSLSLPYQGEKGFCYALSSHLGIHADGTVVPCCLDKESQINLGNLLFQSLEEILNTKRAQQIKVGFQNGKLVENLCQHCSFIKRFQK